MSGASQTDFIREMQRLHDAHLIALRTKDEDAIAHAADDLALFLNYSRTGRLQEYLALKVAQQETKP